MTHHRTLLLSLLIAVTLPCAHAQDAAALKAVAEKALNNNPEVAARWSAYQAATEGLAAAKAARGPRVNLAADAGQDRFRYATAPSTRLNRTGVSLNVSQVLWDGLGNQREKQRVSHERLSRYFELVEASETAALEASRALIDVQRFRRLTQLADENVAEHRKAQAKIQSRTSAGVGRRVDLEQAQARLALAESNLITERANLHDVVARYQRVVGEMPQRQMTPLAATTPLGALDTSLPANGVAALQQAVAQSPAIRASIETVRAAQFAVQTRESLLQPRVELRARTGAGHNYNSLEGRRGDTGAEVVLNWNLYDGGADRARIREQSHLLTQAHDLRDKTCRDVTQVAAIAFNDVGKLAEQTKLLQANTDAIERARQAYRQQFDIGQRSLLDLLNAENEAYTAQRALANAQFDRALATTRLHAAMGQLNTQLGISRSQQDDDATTWTAAEQAPARCPALPPKLEDLL